MKRLFTHPTLGTCSLELRRNSRSITARWRDGRAHFIASASFSADQIYRAIDQLAPRLLAKRPEQRNDVMAEERRVEFDGVAIVITRQSIDPGKVLGYPKLPEAGVAIGTALDLSDPSTMTTVRKLTTKLGARLAERIVLPRAREIATALHLEPRGWRVGYARSTLGTCSGAGLITLSGRLTFYPKDLRDYVVCHELAHMSEMNHSPRFHQVCDAYCRAILSTPERKLEQELKRYTRTLAGDVF